MKKNMKKTIEKRLEVMIFRSNKYIYAQAIDEGKIVASYSSLNLNKKEKQKVNKTQEAKLVGIELAKNLLEKKHKKVRLNTMTSNLFSIVFFIFFYYPASSV